MARQRSRPPQEQPLARQRSRPPEDTMLLVVLLLAFGLVAAAALASAAVAVLAAASETVEPPTVIITRAPPDPTNQTAASFAFGSAWTTALFECALDGSEFDRCTSPHALADLSAGVRTFQVRALDLAGGRGPMASYTWTIDLTPPELAVPSDTVVEATGGAGAVVQYPAASATDASGIAQGPACSPESGSTFGLGTTVVACSASDRAGNVAEATFTVRVLDTSPPVLSGMPADTTIEATGPDGAAVSWSTPTASDLVSGAVAVRCDPEPGSTFPLGDSAVLCVATDEAGNSAEGRFVVTVSDTRPPELTAPPPLEAAATDRQGAMVSFTVTASDAVGVVSGPTCEPRSGETFPLGTTVVACAARDAAGNTGTARFTVTVFDPTPPVITPQITGRLGNNGWYVSPVAVTWTVDDPESGVGSTQGCGPARRNEDTAGVTFTCQATSLGGTASESVTIRVDMTPPGPTTASQDQQNGQYRLRSSDAGAGVAAIFYQVVASGARRSRDDWVRYSEPFNACPSEGAYVLFAFAEDRAGNRENPVVVARYNCLN